MYLLDAVIGVLADHAHLPVPDLDHVLAACTKAGDPPVQAPGRSEYEPDTQCVPQDLKSAVRNLLGFVAWTVTGLCVAGVLMVGGKMAISHNRGEGGEHASGLAWVGGACVLVGTAAAIVGGLV